MTYPNFFHLHPELSPLEAFQRGLEMMTTDFQTVIDTFSSKDLDRQFTPLHLNPNNKQDILQAAAKVAELRPTESRVNYLMKDLEQKHEFIYSLEQTKASLVISEETEEKFTSLLKTFSDFQAQITHKKNQIDEELKTLMEFWEKTPRKLYRPEVYTKGAIYENYLKQDNP